MVDIKSSTLRSNVFETIYDALTSANLLSSTATVTAAYVDKPEAFPQVVVNPSFVREDDYTFTRSYSKQRIEVIIDLYTTKAKDLDLLADQVAVAIKEMSAQGIMLTRWSEGNDIELPNNNKLHTKSISMEFLR